MKQLVVSFVIFFLSTFIVLSKAQEALAKTRLIKSGSTIYTLDEKTYYQLQESRYFYVTFDDPEKPTFVTLLDRNQKPVYKTSYQNIVNTEAVTQINPTYDANVEYKNPTRFQSADKKFELNLRPTLSFESVAINELSDLYQSELTTANGNRFEIKAMIPSTLGVDFGISLNYQSIFWDNSEEEVQFSSLNAGPYLEIPFYLGKYLNPSFNIGAEFSLNATGSAGDFQEKFSKTVWHIGLQNTYFSNYGPFFAEVFLRRHELILNNTNRPVQTQSKAYSLTSTGVALGYRWDITL